VNPLGTLLIKYTCGEGSCRRQIAGMFLSSDGAPVVLAYLPNWSKERTLGSRATASRNRIGNWGLPQYLRPSHPITGTVGDWDGIVIGSSAASGIVDFNCRKHGAQNRTLIVVLEQYESARGGGPREIALGRDVIPEDGPRGS